MSWRLRGTYFESCNCDAICPCRDINGIPGGRSTHGLCLGVLSWVIEDGGADDVDLSGLPVAMATRYSDDEPGSPWTWILYVDRRADEPQRAALEEIFSGRLGGDALTHFPWARKPSELVAVRRAQRDDAPRVPRRLRVELSLRHARPSRTASSSSRSAACAGSAPRSTTPADRARSQAVRQRVLSCSMYRAVPTAAARPR